MTEAKSIKDDLAKRFFFFFFFFPRPEAPATWSRASMYYIHTYIITNQEEPNLDLYIHTYICTVIFSCERERGSGLPCRYRIENKTGNKKRKKKKGGGGKEGKKENM